MASQEAIKLLGTNGGGFFNANSAHPYESPTPLSNFMQMLAIFLIPTALVLMFGRMVGDVRQGWALLAAMTAIFVVAGVVVIGQEQQVNPLLTAVPLLLMQLGAVDFGGTGSGLYGMLTFAIRRPCPA